MQEAYLRWPTTSELQSLLPGGTPTLLAVPPGEVLLWDWNAAGFPLLRVDPDVPPGTRYVFLFGSVLPTNFVPPEIFTREFNRWVSRLSWFARQIVAQLSVIPVAWTAPQPLEVPQEATAMTSPSPALQPITGGVRVVHKCIISGQAVFMTHGVKMTGAPTVAHLQALADGCKSAFDSNIMGNLPTTTSHTETLVQDLTLAGAASAVSTSTAIGNNTATTEPLNTAAIIQWRTARAGRSYRGRTYHAPLAGGAVQEDGRTLVPATQGAFASAWGAYRTAVNALATTNGGKVAVLSQTRGTAEEVTSVTVASVVGTQRGRLR